MQYLLSIDYFTFNYNDKNRGVVLVKDINKGPNYDYRQSNHKI